MNLFKIIQPATPLVPIVISCPHVGTYIPEQLRSIYQPDKIMELDDTDWFIDKLYAFAAELGITIIAATHHRWLIDLNRNADNIPLYADGRVITSITPTTDFNGNNLYQKGLEPTKEDIENRIELYYQPYYKKVYSLLEDSKARFGKALLFDAHSIRKYVPGISETAFPDLILGNNDGKTASQNLSNAAKEILSASDYTFSYNQPFKGGNITRTFGDPVNNIHALQLEMAKTNYMDASERNYDTVKAGKIQVVLKKIFENFIEKLS